MITSPLEQLRSADPPRDANVIGQAAIAVVSDYLWREEIPTSEDLKHLVDFGLRGGPGLKGRLRATYPPNAVAATAPATFI